MNISLHPAASSLHWPLWRAICPRTSVSAIAVLFVSLLLTLPQVARAQTQIEDSSDRLGRKVLTRVAPEYPTLLKTAHIGGIVKLNARVLPNGTVSKVTVLGGNPILADESLKAVMLWKFVPAAGPTNEVLSFRFHP